jgi:predicted regulator of Ras-like GTPase activity (Roadblock/LC7/MglB family)
MLGRVDATQAIAEMIEISPQVREVVVVGPDGGVVGSNAGTPERAQRLADGANRMLEAAAREQPEPAQLEAATTAGSVFVVRDGDRTIAATTTPEPTVGLVFYDLKTCLRSIDPPKQRRRRKPPAAAAGEDADATP